MKVKTEDQSVDFSVLLRNRNKIISGDRGWVDLGGREEGERKDSRQDQVGKEIGEMYRTSGN